MTQRDVMEAGAQQKLPPEALYLPFEAGLHRMLMGLVARHPDELIEIDELYPAEMAERRALLDRRRSEVFAAPRHPYSHGLAAAFPTIGDPASRLAPRGLAGDPPDPADLPPGCPFHPRCSRAHDRCCDAEPLLVSRADGRSVACVDPLPGAGDGDPS